MYGAWYCFHLFKLLSVQLAGISPVIMSFCVSFRNGEFLVNFGSSVVSHVWTRLSPTSMLSAAISWGADVNLVPSIVQFVDLIMVSYLIVVSIIMHCSFGIIVALRFISFCSAILWCCIPWRFCCPGGCHSILSQLIACFSIFG